MDAPPQNCSISEIERHEHTVAEAFVGVLKAEEKIRFAKTALDEAEARLKSQIAGGETDLAAAWANVRKLLEETGEVEVVLAGAATDYKIGWSSPRESVKVEPEAVPDEYVKIERKPKLREIGDHLKKLRASGQPMPNWGRLERSEPRLQWTAVKKGAA